MIIGEPHGGFPEPLRSRILKGLQPVRGRPGQHLPPLNFIQLKDELIEKHGSPISETDVMSSAMYPKVCDDHIKFRQEFGPVTLLNTRIFLTGPKVGEEFEVSTIDEKCKINIFLPVTFRFYLKKESRFTSKHWPYPKFERKLVKEKYSLN